VQIYNQDFIAIARERQSSSYDSPARSWAADLRAATSFATSKIAEPATTVGTK
jgi:hypothetical protein